MCAWDETERALVHKSTYETGIFLSNFQGRGGGGGHLRFWTLFDKFWTFQYAEGFRGPGILIKRSTIVDLSVYAAWLSGPDISQNIKKRFKNIKKSIAELSHLAAAATRRIFVPHTNFGPFWVVKIHLAPLIKISLSNVPDQRYHIVYDGLSKMIIRCN